MGPEANILEPSPEQCARLWLEQPIFSLADMVVIKQTTYKNYKVSHNLRLSELVGWARVRAISTNSEEPALNKGEAEILSFGATNKQRCPVPCTDRKRSMITFKML